MSSASGSGAPLLFARPVAFVDGEYAAGRLDKMTATVDALLSADESAVQRIPLLNSTAPDTLPPFSLVRFRCMVQDQFDPEYYLRIYEEQNTATGEAVRW